MLPDVSLSFWRMPLDASPAPCQMPLDTTYVKMSGTSEQLLPWRPIPKPRHTGSPKNRSAQLSRGVVAANMTDVYEVRDWLLSPSHSRLAPPTGATVPKPGITMSFVKELGLNNC